MELMEVEQTANKVKKGFKKTEVGIIPNDWNVKEIGSFCYCFSGGTPNTSNPRFYNGKIPWITSSELNKIRIESVDSTITEEGLNNSSAKKVNKGTLLLAMYGATAGVCAITNVEGAINQAILAIEPNKDNSELLFQFLRNNKDYIISTYTQGGQPNLSGQIVKKIKVPLPPTLAEQKAIAKSLSDVDALISNLDKLITKKKAIKQGAMQQLLCGKIRLPKFQGKTGYKQSEAGKIPNDWDVDYLDNLTKRIGDGIHTTPNYSDLGEYYFINGNNLNNGKIEITENTKRVSKNEYLIHKRDLSPSTLLLSINGTIGSLAFYNNEKIVLGKSAAYIDLNHKVNKFYLYYILGTKAVSNYIDNELTGSTIKNLGLGSIRNTPIPLPPTMEEQQAIANVLNAMELELKSLEKKKAKYQSIKQAMMQELLTGKTRLV